MAFSLNGYKKYSSSNYKSQEEDEEGEELLSREREESNLLREDQGMSLSNYQAYKDEKYTPSQEAGIEVGTKEPEEEKEEEKKSIWEKLGTFGKKLLFGEEKEDDQRTTLEKAQELFVGFESKGEKENREATRERMKKIQSGEITGEMGENVNLQMYGYTRELIKERADIDAYVEEVTGFNRYDLGMDKSGQYKTTSHIKTEKMEGKNLYKSVKGNADIVDKKTGESIFSDEQKELYNALYSDNTTVGALNEAEKTFQEKVGERYESSGIIPQNLELFYQATQVFDETKTNIAENYQIASKRFTSLTEEGKGWEDLSKKEQTDIVLGYGLDVEDQLETPDGLIAAALNIPGQSLGYGLTMSALAQSGITGTSATGAAFTGVSKVLEVTGKNLLNALNLNAVYDEASQERYYEMTTPEYAYAVDEVGNLAIEKLEEARREEGKTSDALSKLGTFFETFSETWGETLSMTSDLVLDSLVKTKVFNSFASWALKNKGKFAEGTINQLLKEGKFDGPFGEFFEEEFLEPISALIENRKYYGVDTPEGKERMATEILGFIFMGGFGNATAKSELKNKVKEVEDSTGGNGLMSEMMEEKETGLPPIIEEELAKPDVEEEEEVNVYTGEVDVDTSKLSDDQKLEIEKVVNEIQMSMDAGPRKKLVTEMEDGGRNISVEGAELPEYIPEGMRTRKIIGKAVENILADKTAQEGTKVSEVQQLILREAVKRSEGEVETAPLYEAVKDLTNVQYDDQELGDEADKTLEETKFTEVFELAEKQGISVEFDDMENFYDYSFDEIKDIKKASDAVVEFVEAFDIPIETTKDNMIKLYHGTSEANAQKIIEGGFESDFANLSSSIEKEVGGVNGAKYYGDTILEMEVDPRSLTFRTEGEFKVRGENAFKNVKVLEEAKPKPEKKEPKKKEVEKQKETKKPKVAKGVEKELESDKAELEKLSEKANKVKEEFEGKNPMDLWKTATADYLSEKDQQRLQELGGLIERGEFTAKGIKSQADLTELVRVKRELRKLGVGFDKDASLQDLGSLLEKQDSLGFNDLPFRTDGDGRQVLDSEKLDKRTLEEMKKESKRILGNENVQILSQIMNPEGEDVMGKYIDGWISIREGSANKGSTFIHEAGHEAYRMFTTPQEKKLLIKEVIEKQGEKKLRKEWGKKTSEEKYRSESLSGYDADVLTDYAINSLVKSGEGLNKSDNLRGKGVSYQEAKTGLARNGKYLKDRIVFGRNDSGEVILKDGRHLLEAYRQLSIRVPSDKIVFEYGLEKGKDIYNKEHVEDYLVSLGTNDGNDNLEEVKKDDFIITDSINEYNAYELTEVDVDWVLESSGNKQYLDNIRNNPEEYTRSYTEEQDNYNEPIILRTDGEVIDGLGRLTGHVLNKEEKISAYVGLEESKYRGAKLDDNVDAMAEEWLVENTIAYINNQPKTFVGKMKKMIDTFIKRWFRTMDNIDSVQDFYQSLLSGRLLARQKKLDANKAKNIKKKRVSIPGVKTKLDIKFRVERHKEALLREAKEFRIKGEFISHFRGSATQYGKYTPGLRKYGTTEESIRISELGVDPELDLIIYRGIDDFENKIKDPKIIDGDYVTTDYDSANSYSGKKVLEKEVKAKDLIVEFESDFDPKEPFYIGSEFVYSDSKNKLVKYTDEELGKVWEEAQIRKTRYRTEGTIIPMELPEINKLYKEISGQEATIRKSFRGNPKRGLARGKEIELLSTIFQDSEQAQATFAHEIGHVVDFLPEGTTKRGRLIGHIAVLGRNMKQKFGDMNDKEIRKEAYDLSKKWRPFDEKNVPESYVKYRKEASELYADMVSIMINDPTLLKKEAPKFWDGFFEYLHKKPEVKKNMEGMWNALLKDRSEILTQRGQSIRDMTNAGEEKNAMLAETAQKERKGDILREVKDQLIDKNSEIIAQKKKAKDKGFEVSSIEDPEYAVEGLPYVNGYQKDFVQTNYQTIKENLEENGLVWEDLAEYLFLDRIVEERGELTAKEMWDAMEQNLDEDIYEEIQKLIPDKDRTSSVPKQLAKIHELYKDVIDEKGMGMYESLIVPALPNRLGIANPLGFNAKTAKEQKEFTAKKLGKEKMGVLNDAIKKFREATQKVLNREGTNDFFAADTLKEMKANPAYATFQVIDYMDTFISAKVSQQVGTLKGVSNVATSTVQKNLATISAIEINNAKNKTIDFIKKYSPEDITEARSVWNGKGYDFLEPKSKKVALLLSMKDGKLQGYNVDKYIAKAFDVSSSFELKGVVKVLQLLNSKWFRPAYVGLNVGFQTTNFVRDFNRFWKNTPNLTFVRAMKRYGQASSAAWARATNKKNALLSEMYENKALSITYSDIIEGATDETKQIDRIMNKFGLISSKQETKKIKQVFNKFFNALETTGDYIESIPKVAGYIELKEQGKMDANEIAHFIRNYVGSPNFLRKGSAYNITNNVFLFSNAIKEGWRSDIEIATNPTTRSGFWFKTAQRSLLPKLLMFLALKGLFGDWLKDFFEKNSEYDKTNYTLIPLGKIEEDALTLRVPEDETGRFIGGVFWKALNIAFGDKDVKTSDFGDLLAYFGGQLPTVSPATTLLTSLGQMAAGQNPYDAFRNRNVINPYTFKKGGIENWKIYGEWLWEQMGGRIIYQPYDQWEKDKGEELKPIQKAAHIPVLGNVISRWVKLTDYGLQEKEYAKEEEAAKEKARENERIDEKISTSVDKFVENPGVEKMKSEVRKIQEDKLGDRPFGGWKEDESRQATQIRKDYKLEYLKASNDSLYSPMLKSGLQNSEKLVEVEGVKEDLDYGEFTNYLRTLRKFEVISLQFIELMKDEEVITPGLARGLKAINQENYYIK